MTHVEIRHLTSDELLGEVFGDTKDEAMEALDAFCEEKELVVVEEFLVMPGIRQERQAIVH